jgi:Flp pilus assembly protein TadD
MQPNEPRVFWLLGVIQRRQGRPREAIENFRKATQLDPANPDFSDNLYFSLLANRRYGEASAELRRIRAGTSQTLATRYELARISFLEHGTTKTMDEFLAKLTPAEANSPYIQSRQRFWTLVGRNLADTAGRQASPLAPSGAPLQPSPNNDNNTAANEATKQSSELRDRIKGEPDNHRVWNDLALAEASLGNRDEALRCVRKAMELVPISLDALTGRDYRRSFARVQQRTGDREAAISEYARLLRVPFSGLHVHEMRHDQQFSSLRGDPRFEALLNDPKNNEPLF